MKKLFIIFIVLILTGCGMNEIQESGWPNKFPVYEGKGSIYANSDKSVIEVRNVNKGEVEKYFSRIKEEYTSVIVETKSVYQGINESSSMIKVEYLEENNLIIISEN